MENDKRTNVNPFGAQDKLSASMPDILKGIRANDAVSQVPQEFSQLAKDIAEKQQTSQNPLRIDIMDSLKASKKVYSNDAVNHLEKMVKNEMEDKS